MNIIFICLLFILNYANASVIVHKITPNVIQKDFASYTNIHYAKFNVSFENEKNKDLMIFIKYIVEPFDEKPLDDTYIYCKNGRYGEIVRDWKTLDNYYYSCCHKNYDNCQKYCEYTCPIPPAPLELHFIQSITYENVNNVYTMTLSNNTVWEKQSVLFTYVDPFSWEGFLKRVLVWIVCIFIFYGFSSQFTELIQKLSHKHPFVFTISHIISTILFLFFQYFLFQKSLEDHSNRGYIIQKSLYFSMINIIFSLFLIYIPGKKNQTDPNTVEQRFQVEGQTCKNFFHCIKHEYVKKICIFIFTVTTILQCICVFAILDSMIEYLDAALEARISVFVFYIFSSFIFLVSFITAIYEIQIPITFNKNTGQFLQILPETYYKRSIENYTHISKPKVHPESEIANITKKIGIYSTDVENFIPFKNFQMNTGDVFAIDDDEELDDYNILIWKIGVIKNNKIEISSKNTLKNKYCCTRQQLYLEKCYNRNNSSILIYECYDNRLVRYGVLKSGIIHQDYYFVIKIFDILLNFVPDYQEIDYNVNVVDNMRTQFHLTTKILGKFYGIIYFIVALLFIMFVFIQNLINFINIQWTFFNTFYMIYQILLSCVLTIFVFIVSTYISDEETEISKTTNQKKVVNILSQTPKMRGDNCSDSGYISDDEEMDWPELLNETLEYAEQIIRKELKNVLIEKIEIGSTLLNPYLKNRVILWYDPESNTIIQIPKLE